MSALALQALKEALTCIYWYKSDLRSFLKNCLADKSVISHVDWQGYKRQIASDIVDSLTTDQDRHIGDLTRLCHEVVGMKSFRHLEELEDGESKADKARRAVADLKELVDAHDDSKREEEAIQKRRKEHAEKLKNSSAVLQKLQQVCQSYMNLVTSRTLTSQQRGFELERVLYELFELFELDPKASFRIVGEQIDGAFSLEGTEYLLEGKWQKDPVDSGDLDKFSGRIQRKLDNTLGLFLSISGFSEDGVKAHSTGRKLSLLMTGEDLMAVLEGRIDFVSLLLRKKQHAARTGNILLRIHEIVQDE
ncbi:MAG: hypothetical protein ACLPHP_11785 [Candidatus Sulfotelmatobacter sp.]